MKWKNRHETTMEKVNIPFTLGNEVDFLKIVPYLIKLYMITARMQIKLKKFANIEKLERDFTNIVRFF